MHFKMMLEKALQKMLERALQKMLERAVQNMLERALQKMLEKAQQKAACEYVLEKMCTGSLSSGSIHIIRQVIQATSSSSKTMTHTLPQTDGNANTLVYMWLKAFYTVEDFHENCTNKWEDGDDKGGYGKVTHPHFIHASKQESWSQARCGPTAEAKH